MRLREIARLTSLPSAKLLFSSCNVTAPTRTTPMSSVRDPDDDDDDDDEGGDKK